MIKQEIVASFFPTESSENYTLLIHVLLASPLLVTIQNKVIKTQQ